MCRIEAVAKPAPKPDTKNQHLKPIKLKRKQANAYAKEKPLVNTGADVLGVSIAVIVLLGVGWCSCYGAVNGQNTKFEFNFDTE